MKAEFDESEIDRMAARVGLLSQAKWREQRGPHYAWDRATGKTTRLLLRALLLIEAGQKVVLSAPRLLWASDLTNQLRRMANRAGLDHTLVRPPRRRGTNHEIERPHAEGAVLLEDEM